MWDCLVALSTWAENNSGQIQILLGGFAFYLAVKAYRKALDQTKIGLDSIKTAQEQLEHSLIQSELGLRNRFIDNKNQILTILVELIDCASEAIVEINLIDTELLISRIDKCKNHYSEYSKFSEKYIKAEQDITRIKKSLLHVHGECKSNFDSVTEITYENASQLEWWQSNILSNKILLINLVGMVREKKTSILLLMNPVESHNKQ